MNLHFVVDLCTLIRVVDGFICLPLVQHCFGQILCGDSMTVSFNCSTVHGNALSVEPKGFDVQVIMDNILHVSIIFFASIHLFFSCLKVEVQGVVSNFYKFRVAV